MTSHPNDGAVNPPPIRLRSRRRSGPNAIVLAGSTALVLAGAFLVFRQSGLRLDDVVSAIAGSSPVVAGHATGQTAVSTTSAVKVIGSKPAETDRVPSTAPPAERPTGTVDPKVLAASAGFGDPTPTESRAVPGVSLSLQPPAEATRGTSIASLPLQLAPTALTSPTIETPDAGASPAVAPEAAAPAQDPAAEKLDPAAAEAMARRAAAMIKVGDIAAARALLERPARDGYAQAIFALAETYDPRMLTQWGVRGLKGDLGRARVLYGEALKGGVAEARDRLGESDRSATKAVVLGQP
jgi:hypothetical protein